MQGLFHTVRSFADPLQLRNGLAFNYALMPPFPWCTFSGFGNKRTYVKLAFANLLNKGTVVSKSFTTITSDVAKALGTLRKEIPETMQGFNALSKAALASGALSALDKELIALAIGVASRCDACIGFHVKALIRLGVSREQFMETLGVCTLHGWRSVPHVRCRSGSRLRGIHRRQNGITQYQADRKWLSRIFDSSH